MHWPFRDRADSPSAPAQTSALAAEEPRRSDSEEVDREKARPRFASWALEEGEELAPGRRVLARLGGGSRYEVYLVWDEALFALAVAKVLRPDQAAAPRALQELAREAALLDALAHPAMVRGFGATLDGPRPHLVLEHVDGPTLERLIRRHGPLSLDQLLPLALHVVAVLHFLAARRVVHLDVKPGNIVMSAQPRLIDLSIARRFEEAARLRQAIGTDAYMAPEQCAPGELGEVGPAADVWALGATLHHAISGEVPFPRPPDARHSKDPLVRFPQLAQDPALLPDTVPEELEEIVMRMLARDPARRPAAREVAEAFEPLVLAMPERRVRVSRRGRPLVR